MLEFDDDVRVTNNRPKLDEKNGQLMPRSNDYVLVQCDHFRCLAYRDRKGQWRNVFSNEELPEVKEVLS